MTRFLSNIGANIGLAIGLTTSLIAYAAMVGIVLLTFIPGVIYINAREAMTDIAAFIGGRNWEVEESQNA